MIFDVNGHSAALGAAALLSLATSAAAWIRTRGAHGGMDFSVMMGFVALWSLMAGMEASVDDVPVKLIFAKLQYVGIVGAVPMLLRFAAVFSARQKPFHFVRALLIWAIPAVTLVLAMSNERHHLIWSSLSQIRLSGIDILVYGHGPWYTVWVAYCGAITLVAVFLLVQSALRCTGIFMGQAVIFVSAAAMPWIGEALSLWSGFFPGLDLPTIGFAVTGTLLLVGMSRFSLFDIVPIARGALVDGMSDGLVVLDLLNRVVDINPAAHRMLNVRSSVIGTPGQVVCPPLRELLSGPGEDPGILETELDLTGALPSFLHIVIVPIMSRNGQRTGLMVVLRDVTLRRLEEVERERLLEELRSARTDLKVLRGLLPICSSCKKIRDDSGSWRSMEDYIQAHTEAHFSHGICDECVTKLYPGLDLDT